MAAKDSSILLSRDARIVFLLEVTTSATPPALPKELELPKATLRLVVEKNRRRRRGAADAVVDTVGDVACRVPVGELSGGEGAAVVARVFEGLLVPRIDRPALRTDVAAEARKAAAHIRASCAEAELAAGVEFRLRVVFLQESESGQEEEEEETGSDLEFDEESLGRGGGGSDGHWRNEHGQAALTGDDDDDGQFLARPYGGGALEQGGGPSSVPSGFEARSDGPELADQHDLTPRDVQRLVRLAFSGGDVEGDEAYKRALVGGTPVTRASQAAMLDRAMWSTTRRPQQQPTPPSGKPPTRMRTGW